MRPPPSSSSSDPDYEDVEEGDAGEYNTTSSSSGDDDNSPRRSARLAGGRRHRTLPSPPPAHPPPVTGTPLAREVSLRSSALVGGAGVVAGLAATPATAALAPALTTPPTPPTLGVAALLRSREAPPTSTSARRPGFAACTRAHLVGGVFGPRRPVSLIDAMHSRAYISFFSPSGTKLLAAFQQDRRVRVYDAAAGPAVGAATAAASGGEGRPPGAPATGVAPGYPLLKDIACRTLRWTVTDVALNPAESACAYASICPTVHVVGLGAGGPVESVANTTEVHAACHLDEVLGAPPDARLPGFGVWSLRFAPGGGGGGGRDGGGETLLAGGDGRVYIHDVGRQKTTGLLSCHRDDVNAVCFLDPACPSVFATGSDDGLIKLVDRRVGSGGAGAGVPGAAAEAVGSAGAPVALLAGHAAGITFLDARGDGVHLLSNGKCQAAKLWDVRRPSPGGVGAEDAALREVAAVGGLEYDYRFAAPPRRLANAVLSGDTSVATYKGHSVLSTLIRARFSPLESTGGAYVYAGSADGVVRVWDLVSARLVAALAYHQEPVRDVSWHPHPAEPSVLVSSSFDGTLVRWGAAGEAVGVGGGDGSLF